jgi:hypothetical protein
MIDDDRLILTIPAYPSGALTQTVTTGITSHVLKPYYTHLPDACDADFWVNFITTSLFSLTGNHG